MMEIPYRMDALCGCGDRLKKFSSYEKVLKLFFLGYRRMKNGLLGISFENQRYWLGLRKIRKGDQLQIEGFVTLYKQKQWQRKLHRSLCSD